MYLYIQQEVLNPEVTGNPMEAERQLSKVVSVDNRINRSATTKQKRQPKIHPPSFGKKDLLLPFRWTTSKEVANRYSNIGMHDSLSLPDTFQILTHSNKIQRITNHLNGRLPDFCDFRCSKVVKCNLHHTIACTEPYSL